MNQFSNTLKIIFVGTPEFGKIILEKLTQADYRPVLVVTAPDKPVGRKKTLTPPPVKLLAKKYEISFLQPEKIGNCKLEIENLKPDLGIVAAYGQIIPKSILNIPKFGFLNVHPSLLPKYRGPSPIQSAILNGDEETGVTIMLMDEKLDSGPIVTHTKYKIQDTKYTYEELHNELAEMGSKLLIDTLPDWISDRIKAIPQDDSKATWSKILKKEDGRIDWNRPAEYIERQVRGLNPWPGTYDIHNGKILKILNVEIKDKKLIIKTVQPEGKKPMNFEDFLRGHKDYKNHALSY